MRVEIPVELTCMEDGLNLLLITYTKRPHIHLIAIINNYLNLILKHDDITNFTEKKCAYLGMKKYWQWRLMSK